MDVFRRVNDLFVLWVLAFSAIAYVAPDAFRWFKPYIVPGLGLVMLGMGITLVPEDLRRVVRRWRAVLLGVAAQFGIMPLAGWFTAHALGLVEEVKVGVILLTACPGGTASNVIAYLARADVALSISMTAASTLLAPLLTPALLLFYAGQSVRVPFLTQAGEIARIIVAPVLAGLVVRMALERWGRKRILDSVLEIFPTVSVTFIVLIVACIVALNRAQMGHFGAPIVLAGVLTNAAGLAGGYAVSRLLGFDRTMARTISIEVGMQNSGLGVALATQFFTPLTALPSAFFSLWHNLSGPALASYWRRREVKDF